MVKLKKHLHLRLLPLVAATALLSPAPSMACTASCLAPLILAQTAAMVKGFSAVVAAVRGNAQTISVAIAKNAQLVANSNKDTAFEVAKDQAVFRYGFPNKCDAAAAGNGRVVAYGNPGDGSVGGGRSGSFGKGGGGMAKSRDIANNLVAAPIAEAQAALAVKEACGAYVPGGVRGEACKAAQYAFSASSGFPNADIRAETIIDGPQASEQQTIKRRTINPSDPGSYAIDDFMRHVDTPIKPRALTVSEASSQAGRQYLSFNDSYEARISLATKPMRVMNANHAPAKSTINVLKTLLASDASKDFVNEYLSKAVPNWASTGISEDEMMNLEVLKRYTNSNYFVAVAAMPAVTVAREQLLAQSLTNALLWRLIQSTETSGVVQGQAVAATVRQEMTPQLNALYAAAVRR